MNCDIKINELIFNGNNNTFTVEYTLADFDFAQLTKVAFSLEGVSKNSADDSVLFDIVTGPLIEGSGTIVFKMGAAGYTPGLRADATITLFSATTPLGLVFSSPEGPTKVSIVVV